MKIFEIKTSKIKEEFCRPMCSIDFGKQFCKTYKLHMLTPDPIQLSYNEHLTYVFYKGWSNFSSKQRPHIDIRKVSTEI